MKRILTISIFCLFVTSTALSNIASDYLPGYITGGNMSWNRGDKGSTWQAWDFYNDTNPTAPDYGDNPYGEPMLTVNYPVSYYDGNFDGWSGGTGAVDLLIQIPDNPEPSAYKDIWLELGYKGTLVGYSVTPEGPYDYTVEQLLGPESNPDQLWAKAIIGFRISPNPESETISLSVSVVPWCTATASVDYIVVDTICIPEPTSILLACIGIGITNRLRRRRTL